MNELEELTSNEPITYELWQGLSTILYGNDVRQWIIALLVMLLVFSLLSFIKQFLIRQFDKTADRLDIQFIRLMTELLRETRIFFTLSLALSAGFYMLDLPTKLDKFITIIPIIAFLLQVAFWGKRLIDFQLNRLIESKEDIDERQQMSTVLVPVRFLALALLWSLIVLLALDNIGFNVTALIAGLGIGGVAVALAVQNLLGDFFGAMTIAMDKPFVVGDFIVVGEMKGTVENIGLKNTRIRSLSGEQLIIANSDLLSSRIQNFKRMDERRVVFQFGVIYQTAYDKLQAISGMVREIIERHGDQVRFDRAHFFRYGESSLDFEVVYFVLSPDYNVYMDIHQTIHLEMFRVFAEHSIDFAYPTRTLFLETNKDTEASLAN